MSLLRTSIAAGKVREVSQHVRVAIEVLSVGALNWQLAPFDITTVVDNLWTVSQLEVIAHEDADDVDDEQDAATASVPLERDQ